MAKYIISPAGTPSLLMKLEPRVESMSIYSLFISSFWYVSYYNYYPKPPDDLMYSPKKAFIFSSKIDKLYNLFPFQKLWVFRKDL